MPRNWSASMDRFDMLGNSFLCGVGVSAGPTRSAEGFPTGAYHHPARGKMSQTHLLPPHRRPRWRCARGTMRPDGLQALGSDGSRFSPRHATYLAELLSDLRRRRMPGSARRLREAFRRAQWPGQPPPPRQQIAEPVPIRLKWRRSSPRRQSTAPRRRAPPTRDAAAPFR